MALSWCLEVEEEKLPINMEEGKPKLLQCDKCPFETKYQKNLKRHMKVIHNKIKNFKCQLCSHSASRQNDFRNHINAVHLGIKRFSCENCDYSAARKGELQSHKLYNHKEEGQYELNCMLCDKKFIRREDLVRHVKAIHHRIGHKCNLCDKSFGGRAELTKHIALVHEKTRDHVCSYCESTFGLEINLKVHINAIHLKIKPFKCTFNLCDKAFSQKAHLNSNKVYLHVY